MKKYLDDDDHHTISTVGEHDIIEDGDDDIEVIMVSPITLTLPVVGNVWVPEHKNRCCRNKRALVISVVIIGLTILLGATIPIVLRSNSNEPMPESKGGQETAPTAATFSPTASSPLMDPDEGKTTVNGAPEKPRDEDFLQPAQMVPIEDGGRDEANQTREDDNGDTEAITKPPESTISALPFEGVHLDWLTNDIAKGYNNTQELQDDLTNAAKFLVNNVVTRQLEQIKKQTGGGSWGSGPIMNVPVTGLGWRGPALNRDGSEVVGDVTDYETNNQEEGIDEADVTKADDKYVYAAYSDYILVWDKQGNQITQVSMPPMSENQDSGNFVGASSRFGFYQPKAHIESLLLTEGYLVVIVSGYGSNLSKDRGDRPILYDYLGTQIRTYQTSTLNSKQELTLVATKNVHGRFIDAQSMGSYVNIITITGLDTYRLLVEPFQRYTYFDDLTDDEYISAVRDIANDSYIPRFIKLLTEELSLGGAAEFANIMKVNRWQRVGVSQNDNGSQALMDASIFGAGVAHSLATITSLDVTAKPQKMESNSNVEELVTSTSIFFAPSQLMQMYGTDSKLVLATRSWDWNTNVQAMEEVTHLVVLDVRNNENSVSTTFQGIATVRGVILNPYSLDISGNDLRVATTITKRWVFQRQRISTNLSNTTQVVEKSLTENYISVLELENGLKQRGRVQIGKTDEVIMAVRFFDTIAYAVTFASTDPFYVLDLSESMQVLGEYHINGFSNYLHAMNDDQSILLAIGQNATDEGVESGLMITVFDARNPARPEALISYTVISDTSSGASNSVAQWDYKSFRYVDGKLIIPLSIYSYRQWDAGYNVVGETAMDDFAGFIVFNVSTSSISEHFRVSHAADGCHHCGNLSPRSFVYDGNLMTVAGNSVSSTNLNSAVKQWAFNVTIDGETAG